MISISSVSTHALMSSKYFISSKFSTLTFRLCTGPSLYQTHSMKKALDLWPNPTNIATKQVAVFATYNAFCTYGCVDYSAILAKGSYVCLLQFFSQQQRKASHPLWKVRHIHRSLFPAPPTTNCALLQRELAGIVDTTPCSALRPISALCKLIPFLALSLLLHFTDCLQRCRQFVF